MFWTSSALFTYNLYLVVTHNKKTPVEKEPTAVPLVIDAAKATYKYYNNIVDVLLTL